MQSDLPKTDTLQTCLSLLNFQGLRLQACPGTAHLHTNNTHADLRINKNQDEKRGEEHTAAWECPVGVREDGERGMGFSVRDERAVGGFQSCLRNNRAASARRCADVFTLPDLDVNAGLSPLVRGSFRHNRTPPSLPQLAQVVRVRIV